MTARRAFAAMVLALGLAGCSREQPAGAAPAGGADAQDPPAATAVADAPSPAAIDTRSLEREQVGWRFRIDTAARPDGRVLVELLATPATVGAAPLRWDLEGAGELVDAFATDLDGDAWPELLLWWRDGGSLAEGRVDGWRFTADGARQSIALPPLEGDLATGWRGRDQFGAQGDRLVRSFALYRDEDDNASPSAGFVRVIRYRLDGDALVVDETALEPMAGTPQAELLGR